MIATLIESRRFLYFTPFTFLAFSFSLLLFTQLTLFTPPVFPFFLLFFTLFTLVNFPAFLLLFTSFTRFPYFRFPAYFVAYFPVLLRRLRFAFLFLPLPSACSSLLFFRLLPSRISFFRKQASVPLSYSPYFNLFFSFFHFFLEKKRFFLPFFFFPLSI